MTLGDGTKLKFGTDNPDSKGMDILRVGDLLSAAGVDDLDVGHYEEFQLTIPNAPIKTFRHWGINLVVDIKYSNNWKAVDDLSYRYEPRVVPDLNQETGQTEYSENGEFRKKYSRYGIKIYFVFRGVLEQYDFMVMMLTLITGAAILGVAQAIMNLMVLYLFADKEIYKNHIIHTTEDMSVYRSGGMTDEDRKKVREFAKAGNKVGTGVLFDFSHNPNAYEERNEIMARATMSPDELEKVLGSAYAVNEDKDEDGDMLTFPSDGNKHEDKYIKHSRV